MVTSLSRYVRVGAVSLLLVAAACGARPEDLSAGIPSAVDQVCDETHYSSQLFAGALFDGSAHGERSTSYYAQLLTAIAEPPLPCGPEPQEAYRVLHSQFSPWTTVVRAWRSGATPQAVAIRWPHDEPGEPPQVVRRALGGAEWAAIRQAALDVDLLRQRTWPLPPPGGFPLMTHPSSWLFEARIGGQYQAAVRSVGDRD